MGLGTVIAPYLPTIVVAIIVILVIYRLWERCKTGKGGALTKVCHTMVDVVEKITGFVGKIF